MAWTDESIEILKAGWANGLSASQIALRLSGMSRNAVIGKATRLGLDGRRRPSDPSRGRDGAVALGGEALSSATDIDAPTVSPSERPTVETIRNGQCRWPMGDPATEHFHLCGEPTSERVYCAYHCSRAYQRQGAPSKRTVMDEVLARRAKRRACVTGGGDDAAGA